MTIEYHVLILDHHEYVGVTSPHIRKAVVRDPKRIYDFESGMQQVLGVYVVNTRDQNSRWRIKKLNECLDNILSKL